MTLTDIEKEILGFLFGRIGHRAKATITLRELQRHFAEVHSGDFWQVCDELIGKGLIGNYIADNISFTPEGWQVSHTLLGAPAIRHPKQAGATTPPTNEHLAWDLSRLADHQRASQFVLRFRKSLCVYSTPVTQLYTNYDIQVPKDNERKLTILPNPRAHHDTFSGLNADAVVSTGMFIVPTANGDLQLLVPMTGDQWRALPLGVGLNFIQNRLGPDAPFLPVLTKGDLREQRPAQPMLHLHRIILSKIKDRSSMELRAIRRAIQDNLAEHFGFKIPAPSAAA